MSQPSHQASILATAAAVVLVSLERGVPAGIVALVVALQPLATGALPGLVTGESTSARQWASLALGFVGVAVAVGARIEWSDAGATCRWAPQFLATMAWLIFAVLLGVMLVYQRRECRRSMP